MLVLTRPVNASIVIGNNIRITVLEIRKDQIKFGIEAPPEILILREELVPKKD